MNVTKLVIVDTGPLIALIDRLDQNHLACNEALKKLSIRTKLYTSGSVLSEVFHILPPTLQIRERVFSLIEAFPLIIDPIEATHFQRIKEIMFKYQNLSLDFADASLVVMAEKLRADTVFTVDKRDFASIKPKHIRAFSLLPD